ncbi:LacI family DNA-binding transcriptional regulator [Streptomyces chromofuscus]|uniref:LacI family DNA-binding transcriptional regulator n=1 Tax=Streptomyces chromofuscus TaxID=42881 RepID=UPI0016786FA2|nr:LacI family DNA-binding transcriptional regulator [Streptomyces chromofuscus]GGT04720.1 LacI family transcriptional regulator [Streptomyces chromofuscus]
MGASLKDVAALAGVSVKTVSNVVNGYTYVTPHTREKVERALGQLDYRPNLSARNLRQGRTGVIALALPELDAPYFAELSRFVIEAATERGWTVLIEQTDGLPAREREVLDGVREQRIDGLIFSPITVGADELSARTDSTALVLLGERVLEGPTHHVAVDNQLAAREVTEHLLSLGRTRIAAIGRQDNPNANTAHLRLAGYREALATAGIAYDERLAPATSNYHRADGARLMRQLLDLPQPPDAVFCCNDLLALGALRTALSAGLRVPEDIAIAGFDDIEDGRYSTPTLTTIRPDKEQVARVAVEMLEFQINGARSAGRRRPVPCEVTARHDLIVRESTSAGRGDGTQVPAAPEATRTP